MDVMDYNTPSMNGIDESHMSSGTIRFSDHSSDFDEDIDDTAFITLVDYLSRQGSPNPEQISDEEVTSTLTALSPTNLVAYPTPSELGQIAEGQDVFAVEPGTSIFTPGIEEISPVKDSDLPIQEPNISDSCSLRGSPHGFPQQHEEYFASTPLSTFTAESCGSQRLHLHRPDYCQRYIDTVHYPAQNSIDSTPSGGEVKHAELADLAQGRLFPKSRNPEPTVVKRHIFYKYFTN